MVSDTKNPVTHALGERQQCKECACAFYDLNRSPATCPSCGMVQPSKPSIEEVTPQESLEDEGEGVLFDDDDMFLDELG